MACGVSLPRPGDGADADATEECLFREGASCGFCVEDVEDVKNAGIEVDGVAGSARTGLVRVLKKKRKKTQKRAQDHDWRFGCRMTAPVSVSWDRPAPLRKL